MLNYEEIKQKYIIKKKKGAKSKSSVNNIDNLKLHKSIKSDQIDQFSIKTSEGPSKKTSKASTKVDSMTSRTKMGLLNTKTNDYLKSYLEFS
jgi:hypothetical protein